METEVGLLPWQRHLGRQDDSVVCSSVRGAWCKRVTVSTARALERRLRLDSCARWLEYQIVCAGANSTAMDYTQCVSVSHLVQVLSYLAAPDLGRVACVSSRLAVVAGMDALWLQALARHQVGAAPVRNVGSLRRAPWQQWNTGCRRQRETPAGEQYSHRPCCICPSTTHPRSMTAVAFCIQAAGTCNSARAAGG
jgi:hypothetical protein